MWLTNVLNLFKKFFRMFQSTRVQQETIEQAKEKQTADLTKKEKRLEKKESRQIKQIIKLLKSIHHLILNDVAAENIKVGGNALAIDHAVVALRERLKQLIKTNLSFKEEKAVLSNLKTYWAVVRKGLLENLKLKAAGSTKKEMETSRKKSEESLRKIKDKTQRINQLFLLLGIEITAEERITAQKIILLKQAYALLKKEAS